MSHRATFLSLLGACLVCTQVSAQTSPIAESQPASAKSSASELVAHLAENADIYRKTLPSLIAHESIVSEYDEHVFFGRRTYTAEATMRVMRETPDGPLREHRQFTALNGKRIQPPAENATLPLTLYGGFSDFQEDIIGADRRPCFTFVLAPHPNPNAPLEISVSPNADAATTPHCPLGWTAMLRIDPQTLQLTHIEYSDPSAPQNRLIFGSVDLAPTKLGGQTFWLPMTVKARAVVNKTPLQWIARYSDYHQFTATATIVPTTPE